MSANYNAPAVTKLLDIIELLSSENRGFGINEIARILDISVNSVFRICKEMEGREYLNRNTSTGLYQLGTKFFTIGQLVGSRIDLRAKALPIMQALCAQFRETVHLCVIQDDKMVLLDQIETSLPIRIHVETGSLMHLHASAFGKCLLAFQDSETVESVIRKGLLPLTQNTVITKDALFDELHSVVQNGYALDIEEYMPGVNCIGSAVHSDKGEGIASIGIIAPAYRYSAEKLLQAAPAIMDAARQLSSSMGYTVNQLSLFRK